MKPIKEQTEHVLSQEHLSDIQMANKLGVTYNDFFLLLDEYGLQSNTFSQYKILEWVKEAKWFWNERHTEPAWYDDPELIAQQKEALQRREASKREQYNRIYGHID